METKQYTHRKTGQIVTIRTNKIINGQFWRWIDTYYRRNGEMVSGHWRQIKRIPQTLTKVENELKAA